MATQLDFETGQVSSCSCVMGGDDKNRTRDSTEFTIINVWPGILTNRANGGRRLLMEISDA